MVLVVPAVRLGRLSIAQVRAHLRVPLYRNGYALVLSGIATSGLGVVYWTIAARTYSPEVVGSNSAAISSMMFLAGLSQLNLTSALVRFVPVAGHLTRRFVVLTYLITTVIATLVSFGFIQGLDIWAPQLAFIGATPLFAAWFILGSMVWCVNVLEDSVLTGLRQAVWVPFDNALFAALKIALLVGLASALPRFGIFGSWTIAAALAVLPTNLLIFGRLISQHASTECEHTARDILREVFAYVPGDYVGATCWLGTTTLLPVIVAAKAGTVATAYFYLAWQIAFLLHAVGPYMNSSLIVESAHDESKLGTFSLRICVHTLLGVGSAAAVVILGAPYILQVFGEAYADAGTFLLRLLALAAIPNVLTSLSVSVSRVRRRIRNVVAVLALLCFLSLTLSYVLLPAYGIVGVGIAWLTSQCVVATFASFSQLLPLWRSQISTPRGESTVRL